ncbi:MAG TPA: GNAT family N-acetyltransferase [Gemmataceae bacterium]|nr:GNAT family N-acetyltransferase [Gemmataceae bacterium]
MQYRAYTSADRQACLAIFDSNAERFFAPHERAYFETFLESPSGFFGVLCDDQGSVVGCGGFGSRDDGTTVDLTWGMIHSSRQSQGLGKFLAFARFKRLADFPNLQKVKMNTSNETVGFFLKLGFHVVEHISHGYRQGLDRYELEMVVTKEVRARWIQ